ncbi:hypothetical protein [Pseudanabaena sp. PCC 6802]|uniref:hypothetical protein n=1 Tax=Pseudanabaena sp. PCC 6802 TaxID=118173 RepID=UPI00034D1846|nr:hypothetical protein [Pseudanabaena sp. PCC 6802]
MLKLDTRDFSKSAFCGLQEVLKKVGSNSDDRKKAASTAVQGLPAYISAWGLHRLAGDGMKYKDEPRGKAYQQFLLTLKELSGIDKDLTNPNTLFSQLEFREYTGLNRLAIQLAREWAFWAVPVLGQGEES